MLKLLGFLLLACLSSGASELVLGDFKTDLITHPVPYAVILPDGYKDGPPLPMMMYLHGGAGSRDEMVGARPLFDYEWKSGKLPKMIVATISVGPDAFYVDFKDGSQKWESLITGPFRTFIQTTYNASSDPKKNVLFGVSMGGEGALRIGLKHPNLYAAIAAVEPCLQPVLYWKDMTRQMYFWINDDTMEAAFGKPIDPKYWEANNPNLIATLHSKEIQASGIQIWLDVGDEDAMLLFRPVEYFHRILWDAGIKHDYHVVRGGDHAGRTLVPRCIEAAEFIGSAMNPPAPDPDAAKFREMWVPAKQKYGVQ